MAHTISVEKLTDVKLLRRANSFTTGRNSRMALATAYKHQHSPIRTQIFWVECGDIPLFVASHLVRHNVGVQFFQLSKRTDRGSEDFRAVCDNLANSIIFENTEDGAQDLANKVRELSIKFDRYTPVNLAFIVNAEALMNMSHKRLCMKASAETRIIMSEICEKVGEVDAALLPHLVPQCVYRGGICSEPISCRWINSDAGIEVLNEYKTLFQ